MATVSNVTLQIGREEGDRRRVTVRYRVCFSGCETLAGSTFVETVTLRGDDPFWDDHLITIRNTCVKAQEGCVDRELSTSSQSTALLGAVALLALLLASLGIYGVLSYAVTQRTSEIGVRMALGATSREIMVSVGSRGLALTVTGLLAGVGLAAIASGLLTTLLYGFRPGFIPTVAVVAVMLVGVAALACFLPARRASRIDPMVALRQE